MNSSTNSLLLHHHSSACGKVETRVPEICVRRDRDDGSRDGLEIVGYRATATAAYPCHFTRVCPLIELSRSTIFTAHIKVG